LVAECKSIVARWRNYFFQILSVHGVNDVRQREIQTAEPLAPEPRAFEFDLTIEEMKNHKSPGIGQIAAELIQVGSRKTSSEIHNLIISVWNKE